MDSVKSYRKQAELARRLANSFAHDRISHSLHRLADEYERTADELEHEAAEIRSVSEPDRF